VGTKMQPSATAEHNEHRQDDVQRSPVPAKTSASGRLLSRIAEALQVPPTVLYEPATAVTSIKRADRDGAFHPDIDLDHDCLALLDAYRRIRDPQTRQRLLILAEAAGEQA
jgi:hypothetical protein